MKETTLIASPKATANLSLFGQLRNWGRKELSKDKLPVIGESVPGAARVFTLRWRLALLAGFALLLILRIPQAWSHGRFLDEEGTIFAAYAWHQPAGAALWRSFAGYLNLAANASTLLMVKMVRAGVLPLELAPYFTMIVASLFQMLPAVLILTGRGRWLANRWSVIACLLIIAISPKTEEVFANVLHIQFHLALCSALILVLDIPNSRKARLAYLALLLLAPLCGPGAIVLLPIFALRTLVDRDKLRLTQTFVLAGGSVLQMLLFYTNSVARGHLLDLATLANVMFVRLAAMPYFSAPPAQFLGRTIHAAYLSGGVGWWCATAVSLAYFALLIATALRGGMDSAFWLILSGLALAVASFGAGMLSVDSGGWFSIDLAERYNFLPLTLFGMGLVALVMRDDGRYRLICQILCALTLLSGASTFSFPIRDMRQGADWRAEVDKWKKNHNYKLVSWPDRWRIDLSDQDLPCSRPIAGRSDIGDPSYCESSWLNFVLPDNDKKR